MFVYYKRVCRKTLFRELLSWEKSILKTNFPGYNSYYDYDLIYNTNPTRTAWVLVLLSISVLLAYVNP